THAPRGDPWVVDDDFSGVVAIEVVGGLRQRLAAKVQDIPQPRLLARQLSRIQARHFDVPRADGGHVAGEDDAELARGAIPAEPSRLPFGGHAAVGDEDIDLATREPADVELGAGRPDHRVTDNYAHGPRFVMCRLDDGFAASQGELAAARR